ncbi:type IV secretory system conjugative DNA transfer family protein [Pedobacter jamesrossensis]|uniref:Type IV secretory system conjugative DNA transfer family protein n=1 Tax=Pedobacter jamesrossensis TaxID=1908238 RepID=A0ABV8NKH8_9SPHI
MKGLHHEHQLPRRNKAKRYLIFIALFIGLIISLRQNGSSYFTIFFGFAFWGVIFLGYKYFKKERNSIQGDATSPSNTHKSETNNQLFVHQLQIANPYSGIFISGGAGSGKSKSIVEAIIYDAGSKNFSGVVYDFKFPELAKHVETAYADSNVNRYYVNFTDLELTNKLNPIAPEIMRNASFAREFAGAVLKNTNPESIKKPDFWSDNSQTLLSAVFWYLREEHPHFCTLPHAISLVVQPNIEALIKLLQTNYQCADMAAPIAMAIESGASNQLAGVVSSLQISLNKINTPEIYYVTGQGSDLSLNLNDPNNPSILVLGNDPTLVDTYGPVIGLMLTAITKQLNQQGREKSIVLIDEFPTIFIPGIETLPATGRSNKVSTILACQDITQMIDKYGKDKSDTILSNLGNQFYGRTTNPQTGQRVSQLFGKEDKLMASSSINNPGFFKPKTNSESWSFQEKDLVKVQDVASLNTGTFYVILSEADERMGKVSFPINKSFKYSCLPINRQVTNEDVKAVYVKIKKEAQCMLNQVMDI